MVLTSGSIVWSARVQTMLKLLLLAVIVSDFVKCRSFSDGLEVLVATKWQKLTAFLFFLLSASVLWYTDRQMLLSCCTGCFSKICAAEKNCILHKWLKISCENADDFLPGFPPLILQISWHPVNLFQKASTEISM